MKTRAENVLGIHHLFIGSDPAANILFNADSCDACHRLQTGIGKARRVRADG